MRFEVGEHRRDTVDRGRSGRERRATAALVASLAELDERRLYLGEGYSSLFTYCTQCLRLSEHAAYSRIEAARERRSGQDRRPGGPSGLREPLAGELRAFHHGVADALGELSRAHEHLARGIAPALALERIAGLLDKATLAGSDPSGSLAGPLLEPPIPIKNSVTPSCPTPS